MTAADRQAALKRRLGCGLGSTALGPVVTAIIQLGTVPLLLHAWGAAKYGDWLMLSAVPSYLTFANLGFGDASGSDMTGRVARGDRKGALETFQSSWALLLVVSAVVLLAASALVWWIPWRQWMHLASLSNRQAAGIILVLGTWVIVSQQGGIIESGYRCDGNYATGAFWGTMLRLVETALATMAGVWTGSVFSAALTYLGARSLGTLAYGVLLRRKSPWLSLGLKHARRERIRELAAPAVGFMALPLGNAVSIQGFILLIGFLSGPIAVTVVFHAAHTCARQFSTERGACVGDLAGAIGGVRSGRSRICANAAPPRVPGGSGCIRFSQLVPVGRRPVDLPRMDTARGELRRKLLSCSAAGGAG